MRFRSSTSGILIFFALVMFSLGFIPGCPQPSVLAAAPADVTTGIEEVARKNVPAVVHIEVTERVEISNPFLPFEQEPYFKQFTPKLPKKLKGEVHGIGSGMIMDASGHILTNHHVAGGATKMEVQLSNGNTYPGKLVGSDAKTDLAVIRIEAKEPLTAVVFGNSDRLAVGEWVVAIGQPRGLNETVTQGIISAKHRTGLLDPTSYQDFLQTDAPLNPGNSGGPLLNLRGEVIGVNTAIASESGGSEGLGFAVPSNIALHIGKTLIAYGKVERGWLGVSVGHLTPQKAQSMGLKEAKGAVVVEVPKGSPADRAGIRKGDVITAYQGKEIPNAAALQNAVAMTPIGSDVRITVMRQARQQDFTIRLVNMKEAGKILEASAQERLGADFRAMTPKEAEKLDLKTKQGVVVTRVEPKGPLGRAGFEVGDIIVAINGQGISGVDTFADLVAMVPPHQRITLVAVDLKKEAIGRVQVALR